MIQTPLPLLSPEVQGFLEEGYWPTAGSYAVLLRGWVIVNRDVPWTHLSAMVSGKSVGNAKPHPRPDVQSAFPGHSDALLCGFELHLPSLALSDSLDLVLHLDEDPKFITITTLPIHQIPGKSATFPFYPQWRSQFKRSLLHSSLSTGPRFSIVLPIFNPPLEALRVCLRSISRQSYPNWEVILIDDASDEPEVTEIISEFVESDARFKLIQNLSNHGIGHSTNEGIQQAKHDWVTFVDHDDQLVAWALEAIAEQINNAPDIELIYSDEEKITETGTPHSPFFKPGWSPHLLRGVMYVGHLLTVKRDLLQSAGGIDPHFDGIQDYELVLRLSEQSPRVAHIAAPLYQWRMVERSSALEGNIKGDMDKLQVEAVSRHLNRMEHPGIVVEQGRHRINIDPPPRFSTPQYTEVIIPDSGCLEEINSVDPTSAFYLIHTQDLTEIDAESIRRLLFHASSASDLLTVPLLLTSDGVVAESGCTFAPSGNWSRIMTGYDPAGDGYNGTLAIHREVCSTSGSCFVVSQSGWQKLRDACSKQIPLADSIYLSGLTVMIVANARATISASFDSLLRRSIPSKLSEIKDPFWNPNFDAQHADYRLVESSTSPECYQYDLSLAKQTRDGRIRIIGWCIAPKNTQITGARVMIDDWVVKAQTGIDRPDVTSTRNIQTEIYPGFEFRFELPPGRHEIRFEVQSATHPEWVHLESRTTSIELPPLTTTDLLENPDKLVAFQLGIHAKHPPRAITFPIFESARKAALPTLSLVTPSYQQVQYLPQTLNSVTQNSLQGVEHIVMDGNSTDGSTDWLKANPASHRIWHSAPDKGQADAVRKGFGHSTGAPTDIMAWINSDDFYVPHALDFVRSYFTAHPEVDVLYGDRIIVDQNGLEINRWILPPHDPEVLKINDYVPQETLFWRRRVWEAVDGINPSFQFALDWDFLLRIQKAGFTIKHIPEFLACFRVHAAQKTSAKMTTLGQREIDQLRRRTFGRGYAPIELISSPPLLDYLKFSALLDTDQFPD